MNRVPILIYHAIESDDEPVEVKDIGELIYVIGLEEFERQMKYLYDNGYRSVLLDDYVAFAIHHQNKKKTHGSKVCSDLPEKPVIITFDDGHLSNYTFALPVLRKYGFVATFFITTKNIGSPDGMRYEQLREMAGNGMSIQSHTMTHPFLSDLPPQEIRRELRESKSILEQQLGKAIDYLALPGGRCSSTVKSIAMEVGYRAICTSAIGYNRAGTDLYSLKRWVIRRNTKFSTFSSIVRMNYSILTYYRTRYFLLGGLKKIMGNRLYVAMWEKFLRTYGE